MKWIKKIIKVALLVVGVIVTGFFILVIGVMIMDSKPSKPSENVTTPTSYINVSYSDEKALENETYEYEPISFSYQAYHAMNQYLNQHQPSFSYTSYYQVEKAIDYMENSHYQKQHDLSLMNHEGKIDADLLLSQVQRNNDVFLKEGSNVVTTFYKSMDVSSMRKICHIICEVVNQQPVQVSRQEIADTLMDLKIFERTGSAANAYVTDDLTFVFNPTMTSLYAGMQQITGQSSNEDETERAVIVHEIMHLLQYGKSDRNQDNGLEAGMCRMYNVPGYEDALLVDSLWLPWILEASAELKMADYLGIETGTYEKKISYARSYNLSRFNQMHTTLQDAIFSGSLKEATKQLNESSTLDFVNLMYSIEVTQSDPEDFWLSYNQALSEDEKLDCRMKIRQEVISEMTYHYYLNLTRVLYEGKIKDFSTLFYMMRLWELDAFNHLEYTKEDSLESAKPFIAYQHQLQEQLLSNLGLSLEEAWQRYDAYCLYTKDGIHASLDGLNVEDLLTNLRSSNFCRNEAMYHYINQH